MAFDVTNFDQQSILNVGKDLLVNNDIAGSLCIHSTSNNLQQFYNRFGQASIWKAETLSYKINSSMFFEVEFNFIPQESKIKLLLKEALVQTSDEDLKYFVQGVTIPSFTVSSSEEMFTEAGHVINPISILKPNAQTFTISLLNTEYPLHEHVFYPWMRELTANHWSYASRPHTLADIKVHILESKTGQRLYTYILANAYPTDIAAPILSQDAPTAFTRDITFSFNNMYFTTNKKITGNVLNQLFDSFIGRGLKDKVSGLTGSASSAMRDKFGVLTKK